MQKNGLIKLTNSENDLRSKRIELTDLSKNINNRIKNSFKRFDETIIKDIDSIENGNIKVIFKYEDKYFEALDFINKQKYDIIFSS